MKQLIPRKVLFGNPDKAMVRLSHDGQYLSYLAAVDGVMNVWVAPVNDLTAARPVTNDTGRGIRSYAWAYTNQHILYIQDKGGDENWQVYSVDVQTNTLKELTPIEGVLAQIMHISRYHPDEIVVGLNDRVPQLHDVYRINIDSGARTLLVENTEGFLGYVVDDTLQVRFGMQILPDGSSKTMKRVEAGWEEFEHIPYDDTLTTNYLGFDKSGQIVYMMDSQNRNTAALLAVDTQTGAKTLIAEDPRADMSDTLGHPTEKTVQAVAFTYERKHWQVLDPAIQPDLDYLKTVAAGDIEVISRTLDDQHWVVIFMMDNSPQRYYLYDRAAKDARFLFTDRQALEQYTLAKMHPVVIKTRDDLDMVSYYTLPIASDPAGSGKPSGPVPLVLLVHGGPWYRDDWGYNPVHQWLADRGYAVLSVNFRGSTGLGKDFVNAGDKEWGAKMHGDLLDAVDWAVANGITTRNQVAIMGGSYGGYATLIGLTFTPDVFACGVDIVGPSNLHTLIEAIPPYWEPMKALLHARVGDPTTDDGHALLNARSPLTHVDRIKRPLLIGQGANDPRVKRAESDQIVDAMRAKGIPVTYVLYPDEGHGFARPENNLSFFAIAEAFLSAHMECDYEPINEDFTGSSVEIIEGAAGVPGLTEALAAQ